MATVTWSCFGIGRRVARLASTHLMATTVAAGLLAGGSSAPHAVTTGHSPAEVAMSGQATLAPLAAHPGSWSVGVLVMLLACKGLAYALCLGTFRRPVFPAILIGAVFGVLANALLPSIGTLAGLAIGMAAGVAVTGFADHQRSSRDPPAGRCRGPPDAGRDPGGRHRTRRGSDALQLAWPLQPERSRNLTVRGPDPTLEVRTARLPAHVRRTRARSWFLSAARR
jgi:hypothetical protein